MSEANSIAGDGGPCRIMVIGVGGAGNNAVNNMITANLAGVEFIVANTDIQALQQSQCKNCIQIGRQITAGLGAGGKPEMGRKAAEEAIDEIAHAVSGAHMLFVAAGMGGGTGTGAAPVVARIARENGVLTVGVVTKPFDFEGKRRMITAEEGLMELRQNIDALVVVPNQNLFAVANENTTFAEAFKLSDDVLYCGVRSITEVIRTAGTVNLDFADVRTVMSEMGQAMMGTGEATGASRAVDAAESAISSPLLDNASIRGARAALVHISGGVDVRLQEVDEAHQRIKEELHEEANIIWGFTFDSDIEGAIRVSVVATGIDGGATALYPYPSVSTESTPSVAEEPVAFAGRPRNWGRPPAGGFSTPVEQASPVQPDEGSVPEPIMESDDEKIADIDEKNLFVDNPPLVKTQASSSIADRVAGIARHLTNGLGEARTTASASKVVAAPVQQRSGHHHQAQPPRVQTHQPLGGGAGNSRIGIQGGMRRPLTTPPSPPVQGEKTATVQSAAVDTAADSSSSFKNPGGIELHGKARVQRPVPIAGGLSQEDSKEFETYLDIPAFLRRQAN